MVRDFGGCGRGARRGDCICRVVNIVEVAV